MLIELLKFYTTSCPGYVRDMGYLKEEIATEARYSRLVDAWQPHLGNTKKEIIQSTKKCQKNNRALIFGSGHLFDIPLAELSQSFSEVVLVDILHPKKVKKIAAEMKNVRLVDADITCAMSALHTNHNALLESQPNLFLDEEFDFVASVNLLSQIPVIPNKWLRKKRVGDALVYGYCKHLVEAHLDYLKKFSGQKLLITDTEFIARDNEGQIIAQESALYNVDLPDSEQSWTWNIAPAPEIKRNLSFEHKVGVFRI